MCCRQNYQHSLRTCDNIKLNINWSEHNTWFQYISVILRKQVLRNLNLASTTATVLSHLSCVNCDDPTTNLLLGCSSGARRKAGEDILFTAVEASVGRWGGRGTSTAIKTLLPEVIGDGGSVG